MSLLSKAKALPREQRYRITKLTAEQFELALAVVRGEIGYKNAAAVLGIKHHSSAMFYVGRIMCLAVSAGWLVESKRKP